ncbi:uncharacterized protein LOC144710859 isoform X1 [Wolffia australiana]
MVESEMGTAVSAVPSSSGVKIRAKSEEGGDRAKRVKKETLLEVLEQCRAALELLKNSESVEDGQVLDSPVVREDEEDDRCRGLASSGDESESDEVSELSCNWERSKIKLQQLLKSRVESPNFLEKLGRVDISRSQDISDECANWDLITAKDLWEDKQVDIQHGVLKQDDGDGDFVFVKQEDIVDGIACFMATYLLSLKETKELTPRQIQEALSKTFSLKKKKGRLRKAWDGGRVIYNVASWGATAVGIYQNPALLRAASVAFWTSCQTISKFF